MTDARIARSLRDVPEAAAAFTALTNGEHTEAFVAALEKDAGVAALARRALEVVVESADPAAVEAATKHGLLIPEAEDKAGDAECAERAELRADAAKTGRKTTSRAAPPLKTGVELVVREPVQGRDRDRGSVSTMKDDETRDRSRAAPRYETSSLE